MIDIRKHSDVPHSERHLPVEGVHLVGTCWNMLVLEIARAFLKNMSLCVIPQNIVENKKLYEIIATRLLFLGTPFSHLASTKSTARCGNPTISIEDYPLVN